MEENPALQTPAWRRSMLQFATQSFTYTDSLNNSWSRKCGAQSRRKQFLPKKRGFPSSVSLQTAEWGKVLLRVVCLVTLHHSNTEIQSLSVKLIKVYILVWWQRVSDVREQTSQDARKTLLSSDTLAFAPAQTLWKRSQKQIQNGPHPTPTENIYTWRRGSAAAAFNCLNWKLNI